MAKYLDSGRLREVMPGYTLPSADLYLYYLSRSNLPAKMRVFIDFLVAEFKA